MKALLDTLGLRGWPDGLLVLVLALPPLLVQALSPAPPLRGEAASCFSTVRSLYVDHDLDLADEFARLGLGGGGGAPPAGVPSLGPALLWMPFYAAGDVVARARGGPEDGYSETHVRSVALGSLVYAVLGLLLLRRALEDHAPRGVATATVTLLLYATFLYFYVAHEPVMTPALGFFASALLVSAFWRGRGEASPGRALAWGLFAGLAAAVRASSGLLVLLPVSSLLPVLRRSPARALRLLALVAAAFLVGVLPRLLGGAPLSGGAAGGWGRIGRPALLEALFSSRHGLLFWTPVLWGGVLGYVPALRRRGATALALLVPLLALGLVNLVSGISAGSFSNRGFDSALPLLGVGLASALAVLRTLAARRPGVVVSGMGAALVLGNLLFMEVYRRGLIPADDTVSFSRVAESAAGLVSASVGTPVAWPANWAFASEHALPVGQYDLAVGKHLFRGERSLGGVVVMGDERADPALLDEGWSSPRRCGGEFCRGILGRGARILAPLDAAETLDVTVRAEGRGTLLLSVNGSPLAALPLAPALADLRLRAAAGLWHAGVNEVGLDLPPGAKRG